MQEVLFNERQKFNQTWIWVILIPLCLIMLYGLIQQLILGIPSGSNPAPNSALILGALIPIAISALFYLLTLKTHIDKNYLRFSFYPLLKERSHRWEDIKSAQIINYGFVGGWGIRLGTKHGTVYNTSGKMGLKIRLKSGKTFVIGTQKPEALSAVVQELIPQ